MVAPVPLGVLFPRAVHFFQGLRPLLKAVKKHAAEILPGLFVTVIELQIQPAQLFGMPVKALLKLFSPFLFLHSFLFSPVSDRQFSAVIAVILQQSPRDCKVSGTGRNLLVN